GNPGWLNFFIKKGWTVYNSDAVERGRSGWMPYETPFTDEPLFFPEYYPIQLWRIGDGEKNDDNTWKTYENSQFPIKYYDEFLKRLVPMWADSYELTFNAYENLVIKEESCVILAHSQGANFAFEVAEKHPEKVQGIIAIEPGAGGRLVNSKKLKNIPILCLYGDYIKNSQRWMNIYNKTKEYYESIKAHGGKVDVVFLPDIGIHGNSHLMMFEKNNMEIANYISGWLYNNNLTL